MGGAATAVTEGAAAADGLDGLTLDLLDALPFYVLVVDERHRIVLANRAVREAFNLEPAAAAGAFCPRLIHGQDEPYSGCPLEEAVRTGRSAVREMLDEKSGRWLESAIYPTARRTKTGHRLFMHLVRDITDHRRAEEERAAVTVRLEEALTKVISGFIPVCASCRRIRDGEGSWDTAEAYLAGHSSAELTHGLCPACEQRLYGRPGDRVGKK